MQNTLISNTTLKMTIKNSNKEFQSQMQEYIKLMKSQKCGFEWESWKHFNHHTQILQNGKSGIFQSEKLRLKEIFADIGCCTLHCVDSPTRVLILQVEPHEQIHIIQTL